MNKKGIEDTKLEKSSKHLVGVDGWLAFFIFGLVVSIIVNFITGVEDFNSIISGREFTFSNKIWLGTLDILLYLGIILFQAYTIYALSKIKHNAVTLAKLSLVIILVVNISTLIVFQLVDEPLEGTNIFGSSTFLFRSFIFCTIWFLYFTYSKRVKNTYPVANRTTPTLDKIFFSVMIAIPLVFLLLTYIGVNTQSEIPVSDNELELLRTLNPDEFTDGITYFIKPEYMEINRSHVGVVPYFILTDDEAYITILSENYNEDKKEYLDAFYRESYVGFSEGYTLDLSDITENKGTTSNNLEYLEKFVVINGESKYKWGVVVIFDTSSDKLTRMTYFTPFKSISRFNAQKKKLMDSITFS